VLRALGQAEAEVGILIVNDRRMRVLNRTFREKDRPTDVLSFPLQLELRPRGRRAGPLLLGDVVISAETARRQAREQEVPLRRELARLLIHGMLHLLGHDHELPDEARRMRRIENRLMRGVKGKL
jgi:probable rRNA maturation factor